LRAAAQLAQTAYFAGQSGRLATMLVETLEPDGSVSGHSNHFAPIRLQAGRLEAGDIRPQRGDIVDVRITHHTDAQLIAERAIAIAA
jgi:tRNA A37 methylthiotransferase MiaB